MKQLKYIKFNRSNDFVDSSEAWTINIYVHNFNSHAVVFLAEIIIIIQVK